MIYLSKLIFLRELQYFFQSVLENNDVQRSNQVESKDVFSAFLLSRSPYSEIFSRIFQALHRNFAETKSPSNALNVYS